MHLEVAILSAKGGDAGWRDLAEEIVGLALTRFIDDDMGGLKEFFDGDWRPQARPGVRINVCHNLPEMLFGQAEGDHLRIGAAF